MYIKSNSTARLIDMDDYVLINQLPIHINQWDTFEHYYLKDEIDELIDDIVTGDIELKHYVMDKELIAVLKNHITDIQLEFYLSESNQELIGGEWSTTAPAWEQGKYMWQRMIISYPGSDDYSMTEDLVVPSESGTCIAGAKGDKGEKGQSLIDFKQQWYSSTSGDSPMEGDWFYVMPEIENDKYLWTRFELIWENPNETSYTSEVLDQLGEMLKMNGSNIELNSSLLEEFKTEVQNTYQTKEDMENYYTKEEADEKFVAKEEAEENYFTKEEIEESMLNLENKIADSGKSNLVKNGDFFDNLEKWAVINEGSEGPQLQHKVEYPSGRAIVINGELNRGKGILQNIYPETNIENNVFTMSCMMNVNYGSDGVESAYRMYVEVYYIDKTMEFFEITPDTFGEWAKVKHTFEVTKTIDHIELQINLINSTRTLMVSEIMLEYGEIANKFIPNIYEIRENVSEIKSTQVTYEDIQNLQNQINELKAIIEELKNNQ